MSIGKKEGYSIVDVICYTKRGPRERDINSLRSEKGEKRKTMNDAFQKSSLLCCFTSSRG